MLNKEQILQTAEAFALKHSGIVILVYGAAEVMVSSDHMPVSCSVKEGKHLASAYQLEHLIPACARWIPFDNIGWGICYYFQQCYTQSPVELKVPCEPTTPLDQVELKNIGQLASSLVTKHKVM